MRENEPLIGVESCVNAERSVIAVQLHENFFAVVRALGVSYAIPLDCFFHGVLPGCVPKKLWDVDALATYEPDGLARDALGVLVYGVGFG